VCLSEETQDYPRQPWQRPEAIFLLHRYKEHIRKTGQKA
jgi:hypothetical protein